MDGIKIPPGLLLYDAYPNRFDAGSSRLAVTVHGDKRYDLFDLWGPTELIERCAIHLHLLESRGCPALHDFIGWYWEVSRSDEGERGILAVDYEVHLCLELWEERRLE